MSTQSWDFLNISLFSEPKSEVARQLVRKFVYQVCYTGYQVPFYLWWMEPVLKYCKVLKYYDQDSLKIFFSASTLLMMIFKFLKKVLICFKKVISMTKLPISKVESFCKWYSSPKSNKQKKCLHKTIKIGSLTELTTFIVLLKNREMLWSYRKCWKEDWVELRPKPYLLRQSKNFLFALYTSSDDSGF